MKKCRNCAKSLPDNGYVRIFCGPTCYNEYAVRGRPCMRCGALFKGRSHNQKYCCPAKKPAKPQHLVICAECKTTFGTANTRKKFCSAACKCRFNSKIFNARRVVKQPRPRACAYCHNEFTVQGRWRKYCSDKCQVEAGKTLFVDNARRKNEVRRRVSYDWPYVINKLNGAGFRSAEVWEEYGVSRSNLNLIKNGGKEPPYYFAIVLLNKYEIIFNCKPPKFKG